jgi:hypothetical protein
MSKRKRGTLGKSSTSGEQPPAGEAGAAESDDTVKADMAHVSPDVLAGSPDIFASKSHAGTPAPAEPADEMSAPAEEANLAATTSEEDAPAPITEVVEAEPVFAPPAAYTPPPPPPHAARPHRGGSGVALGVVLVVVGLFALGVVLFGIDLTQYGWPLFVIIPGLTLLVVGFLGGGAGASVPGGIVTMLGLVLAYQSSTGDWPSWAFAWALIAPGGVGLGLYLQALRDRDPVMLRRGRAAMFAGALIFLIGFVFFESILGISDTDYGVFGKAALPGLLIVIGVILLVRSIQRGRSAR